MATINRQLLSEVKGYEWNYGFCYDCNPGMKSISKLQRRQCHLSMCQAGKRKPTRKTQENKNVADR